MHGQEKLLAEILLVLLSLIMSAGASTVGFKSAATYHHHPAWQHDFRYPRTDRAERGQAHLCETSPLQLRVNRMQPVNSTPKGRAMRRTQSVHIRHAYHMTIC